MRSPKATQHGGDEGTAEHAYIDSAECIRPDDHATGRHATCRPRRRPYHGHREPPREPPRPAAHRPYARVPSGQGRAHCGELFLILDQPSAPRPAVRIDGPVDANSAPTLHPGLRSASTSGTRSLTVDLTGITHLASANDSGAGAAVREAAAGPSRAGLGASAAAALPCGSSRPAGKLTGKIALITGGDSGDRPGGVVDVRPGRRGRRHCPSARRTVRRRALRSART